MASVPYGVPAAALCRGIVRHSARGTIRKDSATTLRSLLRSLSVGVALRFYAPISPSFPVLPHLDKRLAQQSLWADAKRRSSSVSWRFMALYGL
jgi:hypothetical protein